MSQSTPPPPPPSPNRDVAPSPKRSYAYRRYRFLSTSIPAEFLEVDSLRYFFTVFDPVTATYYSYVEFVKKYNKSEMESFGFSSIIGLVYVSRRQVLDEISSRFPDYSPKIQGRPSRVDYVRRPKRIRQN